MAQEKEKKEEVNKGNLDEKALIKEGAKEKESPAQKIDDDLESSRMTTTDQDQNDENQEDQMVTESIDVIKDASAEEKEEEGAAVPQEKIDEKMKGERADSAFANLSADQEEAKKGAPETSETKNKQADQAENPAHKNERKSAQEQTSSEGENSEIKSENSANTASLPAGRHGAKASTDQEEIKQTKEQPQATPENTSIKGDQKPPKTAQKAGESEENVLETAAPEAENPSTNQQTMDNASTEPSTGEEQAKSIQTQPPETPSESSVKADETPQKTLEEDKKATDQTASTNEDEEDFAAEEQEEETDEGDDVDSALTEDSEDETTAERHSIPKKEYDQMSKEALIKEFKYLLHKHNIQAIKEHVDELRAAFISQFEEEQEEAKERFLEDGGNIIDFRYYSPLKKDFNTLYFEYRDKRSNYFKNLKSDLNKNLDVRSALIEELKDLKDELGGEDSINTTFDKFRDIQERWRSAGNIPRDRYNLVWNNYHHHVENFYDFLHLNREFRDRDFRDNLDKKMKLVEQAEELTKAQDINRAFKELQMLHKMWKEEIGPVAREYREEIWDKFSAATRSIHDSRQEYFKNIDKVHEENLVKKQEVIKQIEEIAAKEEHSHGAWQNAMKKVEALRDEFFKIGKVPRKKNEETWKAFKKTTRNFNRIKNAFYKNQKKEQQENLSKKKELVKIAEDNRENEDLETTIELMKKIQSDWKKIGHVPRRDSDKIWKRFKKACNHVFDRLHADKKEALEEEEGNLKIKQEMLKKAKSLELTGKRDEDLTNIKTLINEWKETGRVPFSQKGIEKDFNKILDGMFKKLDLGRKETEMIKYDNRVAAMADRDDERQIEKERYFISKRIEEVKAEINQLENNLGFFQHVPDDNPMVKEVHKNINDHKKTLEIWKAKMKKIKTIS